MEANQKQSALFVSEVGKPAIAGTREIPTPPDDEVLIKVTAAQILPHDTYGRDSGLFIADHLPYILASNLAGVVQSPSPFYQIGQHIYGPGDPLAPQPDYAGLQQFALLTASNSAVVPHGKSDAEAATLPINAITTFAALSHPTWLAFPPPWTAEAASFDYSAQKLVIIGAGSNCGLLALQFARSVGFGTIVGVASVSGERELRELGATHILDRHLGRDELVEKIRGILGGEDSVMKVYDCVNWTYELAVALVPKEKVSTIATLHQPRTVGELLEKEGKSKAQVRFVSGAGKNWGVEDTGKFWKFLGQVVEDETVKIPKYRMIDGLDAELVNETLDSYRDGNPVVQAVVLPNGKI